MDGSLMVVATQVDSLNSFSLFCSTMMHTNDVTQLVTCSNADVRQAFWSHRLRMVPWADRSLRLAGDPGRGRGTHGGCRGVPSPRCYFSCVWTRRRTSAGPAARLASAVRGSARAGERTWTSRRRAGAPRTSRPAPSCQPRGSAGE